MVYTPDAFWSSRLRGQLKRHAADTLQTRIMAVDMGPFPGHDAHRAHLPRWAAAAITAGIWVRGMR